MQADMKVAVLRSVRVAEERLEVMLRMMEEGEPCEHLLGELRAVQVLLSGVVCKMLRCEASDVMYSLANDPASISQSEAVNKLAMIYEVLLRTSGNR